MTPFHDDGIVTLYEGDCRDVMRELEPESVQCVVTSPPYFSLRDYGIPPSVWGGDPDHAHEWGAIQARTSGGVYLGKNRWQHQANGRDEVQPGERRQELEPFRIAGHPDIPTGAYCACGAWSGTLGLEPTIEQYLADVVEVFAAVRRVLRKDGVVWLNIGDSYAGGSSSAGDGMVALGARHRGGGHKAASTAKPDRQALAGLKAKDRMLMPARVALALQADGWWIRDEVVWHKSNPMPSSVDDRTTPAHEMVYLLSKRARYHYDAAAIAESASTTRPELLGFGERPELGYPGHSADRRREKVPGGWMVGPGRHDEGAATHRERNIGGRRDDFTQMPGGEALELATGRLTRNRRSVWTIPTAPYPDAHFATFPPRLVEPMILAGARPGDVVLDPFGGSGTVGMVARALGRRAILIDLSPEYLRQAVVRSSLGLVDPGGPLPDDGLWAEVV